MCLVTGPLSGELRSPGWDPEPLLCRCPSAHDLRWREPRRSYPTEGSPRQSDQSNSESAPSKKPARTGGAVDSEVRRGCAPHPTPAPRGFSVPARCLPLAHAASVVPAPRQWPVGCHGGPQWALSCFVACKPCGAGAKGQVGAVDLLRNCYFPQSGFVFGFSVSELQFQNVWGISIFFKPLKEFHHASRLRTSVLEELARCLVPVAGEPRNQPASLRKPLASPGAGGAERTGGTPGAGTTVRGALPPILNLSPSPRALVGCRWEGSLGMAQGQNGERIWKVLVSQSCPTLCDPIDRSPPGSSVHGILQARILEWAAMRPQANDPSSHVADKNWSRDGNTLCCQSPWTSLQTIFFSESLDQT
ncbi:uncharacterized protein ACBT57_007012 [Dama dama]